MPQAQSRSKARMFRGHKQSALLDFGPQDIGTHILGLICPLCSVSLPIGAVC